MSVLIATPCYGGQLTLGYFRSAIAIADACRTRGIEYDFLVTEGESLVTRARNNLVATFMRTDYQTLAMIDADIEMTGEDFIKLVESTAKVRGAAVNMKRKDYAECLSCFKDGRQVKRDEMPNEPFEVDYLGAAVMFIDRGVFDTLAEAHPERSYQDPIVGKGYALFEQAIVGDTYLSEDYGFCLTVKEHGIPIVCDPSVKVSHYGQGVWYG